jgi:hypothetical protein
MDLDGLWRAPQLHPDISVTATGIELGTAQPLPAQVRVTFPAPPRAERLRFPTCSTGAETAMTEPRQQVEQVDIFCVLKPLPWILVALVRR